jgi:hypothetical protein
VIFRAACTTRSSLRNWMMIACAAELEAEVSAIEEELEKRSFTAMLSGRYDHDQPSSPSMPARAAPTRRTGRRCSNACTCAGRRRAAMRPDIRYHRRRGGRHQECDHCCEGDYAFGYLRSEKGCIASFVFLLSMPRTAAILRSLWSKSCRRWPWMKPTSRSIRAMSKWMFTVPPVRAGRMFKRTRPPSASRTSRPASWSPVRMNVRRPRTANLR